MSFTRYTILLILWASGLGLFAQPPKKALDHSDFAQWKVLRQSTISQEGNWISFEVNAQRGDGTLQLVRGDGDESHAFPRGYRAKMDAEERFMVFRIKPPFDSTRQAKLDKKKKEDMPTDSLGIWLTENKSLTKVANVTSFQVPEGYEGEAMPWIAFELKQEKQEEAQKDTTEAKAADGNSSKRSKDKKNTQLVLMNPLTGDSTMVVDVSEYAFSQDGSLLGLLTTHGDSIDSVKVQVFEVETQSFRTIFEDAGTAKSLKFDKQSQQLAFLVSSDTTKVKAYELFYWKKELDQAKELLGVGHPSLETGWCVSEHARLSFSESGNRLYLGTAPTPLPEVKDTIPEDEKVRVDVWNWQDGRLQPHQLEELEEDKKKNYLAVYHLETDKLVQLGDKAVDRVSTYGKGESDWALGFARGPYEQLMSWEYPWPEDVYLLNVETGKRLRIREKGMFTTSLSPAGTYAVWYDAESRGWMSRNTESGEEVAITSRIGANLFDEEHDTPSEPRPYGISGWMEGDEFVLISDRYDLWKVDLKGKKMPQNLTRGYGRANKINFSLQTLDPEALYVPEDMLLLGFHEETKQQGFYSLSAKGKKDPQPLMVTDHRYRSVQKAKNSDRLIWTRESFSESPNLWVSGMDFQQPIKLSNANPQQAEFRWGTVELVEWTSYDKKKLQGLLYKPEDFDPNRKYPMLVYFYEKSSDRKHAYSLPQPSRSIIYPSFYVSNEYLVFIPDIVYQTGQPGQDAYNAIVSGTEAMVERYSWIDKDRLGIQGQSWGGYQTAYVITKTNMFAAAMAGAPVSNMTSAYGGIRWGSGLSRMFQYEKTQSRLGATLWEDTERYLKNSPLFYVPEIETPLLMMHNDEDTAVPWYQGIEMFVAMRRLQKPAWLLVYNKEPHNLVQWPNRMDLSIRMKQFFDHYLKGEPMPVWMKEGIPAIDKGRTLGYELEEEAER